MRETCLPGVSVSMDLLDQCARQAALYPRWLVVASTVVAAIVIFWIVAKLLKWALIVLLSVIAVAIVGGVLIWWLG